MPSAQTPSTAKRPLVTVTIEPVGPRSVERREHAIQLMFSFGASAPRHADREHVARVALEALAGLRSGESEPDQRRVNDVSTARRQTHAGTSKTTHTVTGVEATTVSRGRPATKAVARLCDVLEADGYRVTVRERRECAEPGCTMHAMIDWGASNRVPPRWHSETICDAHNYRTCSRCGSIHVLTAVNAAGQGPSVHCEVCGLVIVEWGSSKIWTARLVAKGAPREPQPDR